MLHRVTWLLLTVSILLIQGQSDTQYRLNSNVWPISYVISISPYFDTGDNRAFTFDGEVNIIIKTEVDNVNQIKLHSENLDFISNNISLSRDAAILELNATNPIQFDEKYSFLYINLNAPLQTSIEYLLTISYRGSIRSDMNGFYRSSYVEQGVTKWLGATQMEPTHARKVFPCFDEPEYKATFTIIINRPNIYSTTLANSKLQTTEEISPDYTRDTFYPSPKMSTYLVAFLVSEFKTNSINDSNSKEFGIYTRPEAISQTDYALDFGKRVVDALGDYLGIDYYTTDEYIKLDHIALPDFRAGAMENWGLIKYREGLLLYVPDESTPFYKYRVAQILAHETAHMWFGNLVTCHWWSNTWLNEGFATYFENFITHKIEPELAADNILVTSSLYAAYIADQISNSAALTNIDVNSPAEISGHFGTITYQKGGSIIRMIHHLIGDDAFKRGLNTYLKTNEFNVGLPSKMYEALETGVGTSFVFSDVYPGQTITNVMQSWISQPGYPILTVTIDHETMMVTLRQKRFYSPAREDSDEIYPIPITYTTQIEPDFIDTKPSFILNNETHTFHIPNITDENWIIFNIQETGFYRVNYDSNLWSLIGKNLKNENREDIHYLNRAKIVNDLFAFLNGDVVDFELLYDILEFLIHESDYSVWIAAINGFNGLRSKFLYDSNIVTRIDKYTLHLMEHVISELGFDVQSNDNFETLRNRMLILDYACKIGHNGCIDNSVEIFKQFRETGTTVAPSLRPVVYCIGLRHGSGEDFDFLWNRMLSTNVANEALVIMTALGCTKVEEKLQSYLESITEDTTPIRSQDVTTPLASVLADHSNLHIALEFLKNNYQTLTNIYPSMDTVLLYFTAALHTDKEFEEFESWLESCSDCDNETVETTKAALKTAQGAADWAKLHHADILNAIPGAASFNSPSFVYLLLTFLFVTFVKC